MRSDIDTDFEGERRGEVKRYMEEKYGVAQVCSVGTYATLKIKALLKDFSRLHNVDLGDIERVNHLIEDNIDFTGLFKSSSAYATVKKFVRDNSHFINDIPLAYKQPRSTSIHACATLILPTEKTVYEWIPVKKMTSKDGEPVLVSEWEGSELESVGFLKEDILGIQQLDKFRAILNSIKKQSGKDIDIYNLPFEDKKVFKYFQHGWNGDVFHFGSAGLTGYSKMLKPKNINDLIAGIALYRPGAMESNFHNEYVLRSRKFIANKQDFSDVEYFEGCQDITKDTFGLIVYQETVMKICQQLAGFSLEEADAIRKGMGKKNQEIINKYGQEFIERSIANGYSQEGMEDLWSKMKEFAKYAFNKSHAAAYAITGYIGQYLKVHYPLHYWATAFSFIPSEKKDDKTPIYVSEIHQTGDIKMMPPEINHSGYGFTSNFETNSIYWSLDSVKQAGEKAVEQIIEDKKQNGEFFSLNEFLQRNVMKGSKVTKQVIENLVMSGAFDEVEQIKRTRDRWRLIQAYRDQFKVKVDKTKDLFSINEDELEYNWWWDLQQKRLSGFAFFDFRLLCENYLDSNNKYIDSIAIQDKENLDSYVTTGGYINSIVIKQSKRGEYADIILDDNFEFSIVKFWQDGWSLAKHLLEGKEKCLLLISGKVTYDKYKKRNIISTTENSDILILE